MVTVPRETPLAKNCTLATVPSLSVAVAVTVVATPVPTALPFSGLVMLTTGGAPLSDGITAMASERVVVWLPALSVAVAVRTCVPVVAGVHETL